MRICIADFPVVKVFVTRRLSYGKTVGIGIQENLYNGSYNDFVDALLLGDKKAVCS